MKVKRKINNIIIRGIVICLLASEPVHVNNNPVNMKAIPKRRMLYIDNSWSVGNELKTINAMQLNLIKFFFIELIRKEVCFISNKVQLFLLPHFQKRTSKIPCREHFVPSEHIVLYCYTTPQFL